MKLKLKNYRVIKKIGHGGMGLVYVAEDLALGRLVALKVLAPYLVQDPEILERFRFEARNQAQLVHSNITMVYSFLVEDEQAFLVLEFIDGETLESRINREGRIVAMEALPIFRKILGALGYAHSKGVIHRDIKPGNIAFTSEGNVKIMDFGIALNIEETGRLTRTGHVLGTPHYMAPEQILGKELTFRTDIYALGITLFEMLTGRLPFDSKSDYEVRVAQINHPPPSPRSFGYQDITPELEEVILKALAKEPEARFSSAREFLQALEAAVGRDHLVTRVKGMHRDQSTQILEANREPGPPPSEPEEAEPAAPPVEAQAEEPLVPPPPELPQEEPSTPLPFAPYIEEPPAPPLAEAQESSVAPPPEEIEALPVSPLSEVEREEPSAPPPEPQVEEPLVPPPSELPREESSTPSPFAPYIEKPPAPPLAEAQESSVAPPPEEIEALPVSPLSEVEKEEPSAPPPEPQAEEPLVPPPSELPQEEPSTPLPFAPYIEEPPAPPLAEAQESSVAPPPEEIEALPVSPLSEVEREEAFVSAPSEQRIEAPVVPPPSELKRRKGKPASLPSRKQQSGEPAAMPVLEKPFVPPDVQTGWFSRRRLIFLPLGLLSILALVIFFKVLLPLGPSPTSKGLAPPQPGATAQERGAPPAPQPEKKPPVASPVSPSPKESLPAKSPEVATEPPDKEKPMPLAALPPLEKKAETPPAKGPTPDELRKAIKDSLAAQGFSEVEVQVEEGKGVVISGNVKNASQKNKIIQTINAMGLAVPTDYGKLKVMKEAVAKTVKQKRPEPPSTTQILEAAPKPAVPEAPRKPLPPRIDGGGKEAVAETVKPKEQAPPKPLPPRMDRGNIQF